MAYKKINKRVDPTQLLEEMAKNGIEANILQYPDGTTHLEVLKGTVTNSIIKNHKPTPKLSKEDIIKSLTTLEDVKEYLKGL